MNNTISLPDMGQNHGHWIYLDENGIQKYLVVRKFDPETKKKFFIPYHVHDSKWKTGLGGIKTKPIYGIERLSQNPTKRILVVEGEKTADAANALFGDFIAISWMGGAQSASKADWSGFRGRDITLVPDNDEVGVEAMRLVGEALLALGNTVRACDVSKLGDKGWDIADILTGENASVDFDTVKMCIDEAPIVTLFAAPIDNPKFPHLSDNGRPLYMVDNIRYIIDSYGIKVRYNTMRKCVEIDGQDTSIDVSFVMSSNKIKDYCTLNGLPRLDITEHLMCASIHNSYHPAIEMIQSKPWDGVSRIEDLVNTIQSPLGGSVSMVITKWLISCVAALYEPNGISADGMLVFQGEQKIGKTQWFNRLVPASHKHLVMEGIHLDASNKDDVIRATSVWLGELGEIECTLRKSDVSILKNFITRSSDTYRAPYGRIMQTFRRQTIYFGSVNETNFLVDKTGNRRFWVIPVTKIDYSHDIDMQQLWAEIKSMYDSGASYRLTDEEQQIVNDNNREHEMDNPMEDLVDYYFDWDSPERKTYMSSIQILETIGYSRTASNLSSLSIQLGFILKKHEIPKGTGKKRRMFIMPSPKIPAQFHE